MKEERIVDHRRNGTMTAKTTGIKGERCIEELKRFFPNSLNSTRFSTLANTRKRMLQSRTHQSNVNVLEVETNERCMA